jgi:Ca2+-binding EF-hand superfamily protein
MTPMAIAKAKKRMKLLKERDAQRQEKLRAQLEEWFEKFDSNGDGQFQRDELRELLIYLFPNNTAPAEETIDLLMIRATEIETSSLKVRGNKDGAVSRNELLETVLRYRDHIAEEKYLNGFFEEYDKVIAPSPSITRLACLSAPRAQSEQTTPLCTLSPVPVSVPSFSPLRLPGQLGHVRRQRVACPAKGVRTRGPRSRRRRCRLRARAVR